jgi:hypothetical protein
MAIFLYARRHEAGGCFLPEPLAAGRFSKEVRVGFA